MGFSILIAVFHQVSCLLPNPEGPKLIHQPLEKIPEMVHYASSQKLASIRLNFATLLIEMV
jgi:hypothetical protein